MMRRFFHTLLPTAALLAVVACTKDDNVGKTFDNNAISVESANLSFNDEPSKQVHQYQLYALLTIGARPRSAETPLR